MYELRNCPFCEGEAKFDTTDIKLNAPKKAVTFSFQIKCTECGVTPPKANGRTVVYLADDGSIAVGTQDEREKAADVWNGETDD